MSARTTALDVLVACRKQQGWSNGVLKEYIERDGLDRRDAALATRLCYGVMQNRGLLDFYLKQLLTGKIKDLHPMIRDVLHLGVYQICMMDKIPDSAAVNESVAMAKKYCKRQSFAPGLVNAVLRSAVRTKDTLQQPKTLADRYSHPQKLIELLGDSVGDRLEMMLEADNKTPPTVVQVNTLRTTTEELTRRLEEENVSVQPHSWMPDCLLLGNTGSLDKLKAFREGLFYVQDAASKLCVACADLPGIQPKNVLDCCAAPGGKTFAAAAILNGKGSIHSCDIHSHKLELIRKGAQRLGFDNIRVYEQDATKAHAGWENAMDVVFADVPCSGYGIIRKKPDIRYKDPATMEELPQLQLEILSRQAEYVRPGGVLMYSTCTVLRRENEQVVAAFLQTHPDFYNEPLPLPDTFPKNESGMLTLIPGEFDTDGFFICRLRRK